MEFINKASKQIHWQNRPSLEKNIFRGSNPGITIHFTISFVYSLGIRVIKVCLELQSIIYPGIPNNWGSPSALKNLG
jgi:hypothetical protein